ncbi:MAG TPA: SigB/SigF/SigG family RNA polymerase sigma factor [Abditibacterium sp.]
MDFAPSLPPSGPSAPDLEPATEVSALPQLVSAAPVFAEAPAVLSPADSADSADSEVNSEVNFAAADGAPPVERVSGDSHTDFEVLFASWKSSGDPQLRDRLILSQRNLVTYLARRFMDRGEMFDDVMQVGLLGLINALDAFDPTRGVKFSTFAIPSISGEIRRYFRDKVGVMRVPRRMQELYAVIQNRAEELTQRLARSPTYAEIAFSLEIEIEEVIETLELGNALDPQSLDDHVMGEEGTLLSDTIGGPDPDIDAYEEHAALQTALARLTAQERRALELAYFEGFSQVEIAREMGVSQMHISRLLRRALSQLKQFLEEV